MPTSHARAERQIERLLDLAKTLTGRKYWSIPELAEHCQVARQTIYDDLNILSKVCYLRQEKKRGGWRIEPGGNPLPFTFSQEEAEALHLAIVTSPIAHHPAFEEPLRRVQWQLRRPLAERIREAVQRLRGQVSAPAVSAETEAARASFQALWQGLRERRTVRTLYQPGGAPSPWVHTIDPYGLHFRESNAYLVGRCHEYPEPWRQFHLLRFHRAELTDATFDVPERFDLDQEVAQMAHGFGGPPLSILFTVAPEKAYLFRSERHPTQETVEERPDGSLVLRVNAPRQFSWHLLELGPAVEILSPPELRAEFRSIGQALAKIYESPP
jgi:predicted DNA-binding transcriptional regulator YafY